MNTNKSFIVAALLTSVAAVSFAQAPESSADKGTPSASVAKAVHHKKHHHHHHHHHHAHQSAAAADAAPAGK